MTHPTTRLLAAAAVAPLFLLGACGTDDVEAPRRVPRATR